MTPTTAVPQMVFNHASTHNGPAAWLLVVGAIIAGAAGGTMAALLVYGWAFLRDGRV
jgi:hypothetical protein